VSPVKYGLGFYIPEDDILHSHCCEHLKSFTSAPILFLHGMMLRLKNNFIFIDTIVHVHTVRRTFVHLPITDFHQALV
jgi:hypothetical protein